MGLGEEAAEVGVARGRLGQEGDVEAGVGVAAGPVPGARPLLSQEAPEEGGGAPGGRLRPPLQPFHRGGLDRDLGPGDRLDPLALREAGELHGPVEAVVVGEGQGRVAQLLRPQHQLLGVGGPVQEGEARVAVELDVGGGGGHPASRSAMDGSFP